MSLYNLYGLELTFYGSEDERAYSFWTFNLKLESWFSEWTLKTELRTRDNQTDNKRTMTGVL